MGGVHSNTVLKPDMSGIGSLATTFQTMAGRLGGATALKPANYAVLHTHQFHQKTIPEAGSRLADENQDHEIEPHNIEPTHQVLLEG